MICVFFSRDKNDWQCKFNQRRFRYILRSISHKKGTRKNWFRDQSLSDEDKKDSAVRIPQKKINHINAVSLFTFYIPKLQSLTSRSDLELIICYQILHTLNHTFYYTNYFIYTLEQYGVPSDKFDAIRSYLVGIHVIIKDIWYLGKLLKLWFIIYLYRDHINEEYRFIKLGKPENNHIIDYKSFQNQYHYIYTKII